MDQDLADDFDDADHDCDPEVCTMAVFYDIEILSQSKLFLRS